MNENLLHSASYRSIRVVRSVLVSVLYSFSDGFDYTFLIRHYMDVLLGFKLPLPILTVSECLFSVTVLTFYNHEKEAIGGYASSSRTSREGRNNRCRMNTIR